MISEKTKSNLHEIFAAVGAPALAMDAAHEVSVTPIDVLREPVLGDDQETVVMITVASFKFKLLMLFRMPASEEIAAYYSKPASELGFGDVFPETCNLCGGAVNRELARQFEHLGLSTPTEVEPECLVELDVLRPASVSCHGVSIDNSIHFEVVLVLVAYAPFEIVFPAPEKHNFGELELL